MSIKSNAAQVVKAGTFKSSTVLSNKEFAAVAKSINPNLFTKQRTRADRARSTLSLVTVQGTINEHLRPRGMVLKSRNYYEEFYVVKNAKAQKEVERYEFVSSNAADKASVLLSGIRKSLKSRK